MCWASGLICVLCNCCIYYCYWRRGWKDNESGESTYGEDHQLVSKAVQEIVEAVQQAVDGSVGVLHCWCAALLYNVYIPDS